VKLYLFENDRLVIKGGWKQRPGTSRIHIVDVSKNELIDEFTCLSPVLSPTGRFWVYQKHKYAHGIPVEQPTIVLIYDMKKSPSENRLTEMDTTQRHRFNAGLPIYPQAYVEAKKYVLQGQWEKGRENPHVRSPFLWSDDEKQILFLSSYKEQAYLIRIDLSAGFEKPKIFERSIDIADLIKTSYSEKVRRKQAERIKAFSATDICWDGKEHVIVKPSKAYYSLEEEISLRVP
jgi:hypothetical protein